MHSSNLYWTTCRSFCYDGIHDSLLLLVEKRLCWYTCPLYTCSASENSDSIINLQQKTIFAGDIKLSAQLYHNASRHATIYRASSPGSQVTRCQRRAKPIKTRWNRSDTVKNTKNVRYVKHRDHKDALYFPHKPL